MKTFLRKGKRKESGFTLIEILVVVIIIAILAAMILPQMLGQSERGAIAEAQNMLGALRRAQMTYSDVKGIDGGAGDSFIVLTDCGADNTTCAAELAELNLGAMQTSGYFKFSCAAAGTCTATKKAGTYANATITIGIRSGTYTCGGAEAGKKYVAADSSDSKKGCKAA